MFILTLAGKEKEGAYSVEDDTGQQIFIDKFGAQTTSVPDDNFFIEGKGSALYKLDDLQQQVP